MLEFTYDSAEYGRRRSLLERAGTLFNEYMNPHSRIAAVSGSPSKILTWSCGITPIGRLAPYEWENLHHSISEEAQRIANMINHDPESRVGERRIRYWVSSEPVYRWVGSTLNLDLDTGKLPSGEELRKIEVMFSFPETLK